MSFHNVRDKFGRFTKLAPNKRSVAKPITKSKKNLLSRDYLVIDQSSSMSIIAKQTVSNINEYINNLRDLSKTVRIDANTLLFDTFVHPIFSTHLDRSRPWVLGVDYRPNGLTALNDALAKAIRHAIEVHDKGDQVVITVITDGFENASTEFPSSNPRKIRGLVDLARDKYNFTINFIGAGNFLDVQAAAQNIGIFASNTTNYVASNAGVNKVMNKLSSAREASTMSYASTGENNNIGFFSND